MWGEKPENRPAQVIKYRRMHSAHPAGKLRRVDSWSNSD